MNIDDLADLEDRAALAAHFAGKAAGHSGVSLEALDAALDGIDADKRAGWQPGSTTGTAGGNALRSLP